MAWQDIVLTLVQVVASIALLPTVFQKEKPAIATSIMTTFLLVGVVVVNISLSYWVAAAATAVTGGLWFLLAIQATKSH